MRSVLAGLAVWIVVGMGAAAARAEGGGVKIHVEAEERTFFLGEPVMLRVGIENTGTEAVRFQFNNVTHGLKMTAADDAGKAAGIHYAPEPGGMMTTEVEIGPGETKWLREELFNHVVFEKAGSYRVRVAVEVKVKGAGGKSEASGDIALKVAMPTEAEAAEVVKRIAAAPDADTTQVLDDPPAVGVAHDMGSLWLPEYLPVLLRLVANGDAEAVRGVGSIDTVEATGELVKMLESKSSGVRDAADLEMLDRLPVSKEEEAVADEQERALRGRVSAAAWREEFREPVRAAAIDRATGADGDPVAAACMLCTVGNKEDFGLMLKALDGEVARGKETGEFDAIVLTAAEILVRRGAAVPEEGKSVGGELVFVRHLEVDRLYRPAGWEERLAEASRADFEGLRKEATGAMKGMAGDLGPTLSAALVAQLDDPSEDVRGEAISAVGERKISAARERLMEIVRKTTSNGELSVAVEAMAGLGHRTEALEATVDRVGEMAGVTADQKLLQVFASKGEGFASQKDAVVVAKSRELWKVYLKEHAEEIDAGKKLDATKAPVEMFFGNEYVILEGGKTYPPGRGGE